MASREFVVAANDAAKTVKISRPKYEARVRYKLSCAAITIVIKTFEIHINVSDSIRQMRLGVVFIEGLL